MASSSLVPSHSSTPYLYKACDWMLGANLLESYHEAKETQATQAAVAAQEADESFKCCSVKTAKTAIAIITFPIRARNAATGLVAKVVAIPITYYMEETYKETARDLANRTIVGATIVGPIVATTTSIATDVVAIGPLVAGSITYGFGSLISMAGRGLAPEEDTGLFAGLKRRITGAPTPQPGFFAKMSSAISYVGDSVSSTGTTVTKVGVSVLRLQPEYLLVNEVYLPKVRKYGIIGTEWLLKSCVITPLFMKLVYAMAPQEFLPGLTAIFTHSDYTSKGIQVIDAAHFLLMWGPCIWCAAKITYSYVSYNHQMQQIDERWERRFQNAAQRERDNAEAYRRLASESSIARAIGSDLDAPD